jgi:hypothetical protein
MKRRDLVVVEVRDDERPRYVPFTVRTPSDTSTVRDRLTVRRAVVSIGNDDGLAADRLQVVSDVACTTAPLASHVRDLKRYRQHALSARCREKRSGKTMMVSNASEPQKIVRGAVMDSIRR